MPPNSYTRGSAASLQGLIITEVQKESPTNDFGYPYLLQALGDERNRTKILWTQLFEKSSPTDIKRVAFSSSHKHLLLLVTSFLIKKKGFLLPFEEREKLCLQASRTEECPAPHQNAAVTFTVTLLPLRGDRGCLRPDHEVTPSPRQTPVWAVRECEAGGEGAQTVAETLQCFREPCAGGGLSQLLPILKRGDHLHKLLPGCSPACWQHRVGAAILCVSAQRDEEVVWGEVPGQIQKSLWEK